MKIFQCRPPGSLRGTKKISARVCVIPDLRNLIFDLCRRLSGQQKQQQAAQSEEIEEQGDEEGEYEDEEEVWICLNSRQILQIIKSLHEMTIF